MLERPKPAICYKLISTNTLIRAFGYIGGCGLVFVNRWNETWLIFGLFNAVKTNKKTQYEYNSNVKYYSLLGHQTFR